MTLAQRDAKTKRQGLLPGPCRRLPHYLRDTGQRPARGCGRSGTQKGYLLN